MTDHLNNAGLFLIQALFDLYIFIVMLRIILQWVGTDYFNPIFEFTSRLTSPPLKPLRRVIPIWHGIDIAAIVLLLALEVIKLTISIWLQYGSSPTFSGLVVFAFAELLNQLINIFVFAIVVQAILSWFNPLASNSFVEILYRLSEPLIRPVRRILPPIAGFDLSPIPVLIILRLLTYLIVAPLLQIGHELTLAGAIE